MENGVWFTRPSMSWVRPWALRGLPNIKHRYKFRSPDTCVLLITLCLVIGSSMCINWLQTKLSSTFLGRAQHSTQCSSGTQVQHSSLLTRPPTGQSYWKLSACDGQRTGSEGVGSPTCQKWGWPSCQGVAAWTYLQKPNLLTGTLTGKLRDQVSHLYWNTAIPWS